MGIILMIRYIIRNRRELKNLVHEEELRLVRVENERKRHQLDLCQKHQQRMPGAHHSSHNCHYCQLLETLQKSPRLVDRGSLAVTADTNFQPEMISFRVEDIDRLVKAVTRARDASISGGP